MMEKSLRTESRSVRPFAKLSPIEELFKSVRLIANDHSYVPGAAVIPEANYRNASYKIELGFEISQLKEAIEAANIPFVDTALVCISKSRMLKAMHIQILKPLRKVSTQTEIQLDVEQEPLVYRDKMGFKLFVAVVLIRNLPKELLRPSLTGTWLGQARFSVGPESREISFSPTKLTDGMRIAEDLPKQTL